MLPDTVTDTEHILVVVCMLQIVSEAGGSSRAQPPRWRPWNHRHLWALNLLHRRSDLVLPRQLTTLAERIVPALLVLARSGLRFIATALPAIRTAVLPAKAAGDSRVTATIGMTIAAIATIAIETITAGIGGMVVMVVDIVEAATTTTATATATTTTDTIGMTIGAAAVLITSEAAGTEAIDATTTIMIGETMPTTIAVAIATTKAKGR
mmetsp:Transcript_35170/g.77072  ORF Transcript_35170/g.77072 Transcript_35170/m.77072 type:complete len:209 (+) Transcript_35170:148-774(+)